jgi:hypothetical protein
MRLSIGMKPTELNVLRRAPVAVATALLLYTGLACLIFAHHRFFFRHAYFGGRGDPQLYMWGLAWWPYAIAHHLNPFITYAQYSPEGFNLTWTTSVPALAILAWPVTAVWNPIVSFNVLTFAGPILAATATFMLCRELAGKYLPSLIGGWLFGFSSYEIGHLRGHLDLDSTALIPTLAWLATLLYKDKIGPRTFIAAATALLTFQFGTSPEIFATATVFGFIVLILALVVKAADIGRLKLVAIGFGGAYALWLVIVSPFLYFMLKGSSGVPQLIEPANTYVADILNFGVPTQITAVNSAWAAAMAKHFTGNDAENGAYLGVPLFMIIAAFAATSWRDRWTRVLLAIFAVLVVCSFGPYLHFKGHSLCPMPWWLAEKLPLLRQALPVRFSLYVSLVVGIIAALWLTSLSEQQSTLGYMLVLLAIFTLLPNIRGKRAYWFTDINDLRTPLFFSQGTYKQVLQPGDNIIVLPWAYSTLWQAISGMYFHLAGGDISPYITPTFTQWAVVQMSYAKEPTPSVSDELRRFCEEKDVRAVVLTASAFKQWDPVLKGMGWQRFEIGGVIVYRIPLAQSR